MPLIKRGLFNETKVFSPVRNWGTTSIKKTALYRRKDDSGADNFLPVRSMADGAYIIPPTTEIRSSKFGIIDRRELLEKLASSRVDESL